MTPILLISLFLSFLPAASLTEGADPTGTSQAIPELFATSDQCMACHNGLVTSRGEDVSIGSSWRSSMMAHSAKDPYWQAAVRRETLQHPLAKAAIENECSACHMPMSRFHAKASGGMGEVFANLPAGAAGSDPLAAEGVSCTMCHQIEAKGLGEKESFTAGFSVDSRTPLGNRSIFGPFEVDAGRKRLMRSASQFEPVQAAHSQSSELCATCHTLYTHALSPNGEVVGELPEQVPYLEWKHSSYPGSRSCQSCHMPVVEEEMPITGVMGQPRKGFSRHVFRGGNFFMVRVLNRYRGELGVQALPQELDTTARRTFDHLEAAAGEISIENVRVSGSQLEADVSVTNLAGHKLPTAYPSRRVWIHFRVRNRSGEVVFESGGFQPDGSVQGNDNDDDPSRFEPHYSLIDDAEKVQIYEAIMADPDDNVTTGLLKAVRFIKDNRILPEGFDKATAGQDISVKGNAAEDGDFNAEGDRIRFAVPVNPEQGPFNVQADLWYQPIAYRWAQNLLQEDAPEIARFVSYYNSMSAESAALLAHASGQAE